MEVKADEEGNDLNLIDFPVDLPILIGQIRYNNKDSMNLVDFSAVLLLLLLKIHCESDVLTFSKVLYIPGRYYSLINNTYNISKLDDYFDVDIKF